MATLVLGVVGSSIGMGFGGAILGLSGAAIGGLIGSTVGSVIDSWIISSLAPTQRIEGARLESLRITSSTEGAVIPRLYGRMRIGGNIVWATDFREETRTTTQRGGGKGGGGKVRTTEYLYYASFAVALCEGPITGIGRIWADGKPLDMSGITIHWYPGDEAQAPDPFIAAKMGAANTPAYRGTAYVVFEDLPLGDFGNRIPQLSFEVFRPLADPDTAEGLTRAVTMIPASGEFTYATQAIRKTTGGAFGGTSGGTTSAENLNALQDTADMVVALDRLQAMAPAVESVSLVVAWFGTDLRAGNCAIKPGVEVAAKATTPRVWSVNAVTRANAHLVSRDSEDRPVYGGTPSDFAVVQAIQEMKARGLRVTFYPFILMDVPPGNSLPNPYSDNAAQTGQPVFPWRGRITCSPSAGFAGTVDKTATAATQVSGFFGGATPANFSVSGETVSWTGAAGDWGLRRMILHYAHLCAAAGGVDAFLIGSEMRGLTTVRSGASTYPAVQAFRDLAASVRGVLGAGTRISYAADWSEYFGHQPGDGSGDVFFHLDPLWADANTDFIAIDNYMPLSDWRDGFDHADAQAGWPAIHDRGYLQANIAGGEGYDWFYGSEADRSAQVRTPITDGAVGKPWVFRYKDLRAWWSEPHFNRPGGVESGTPTAWVPQSKPIWFTELGCPAIDRGTNQPNVFFDPKSSESFTPYFSRGWRDDAIQRAYLEATYLWWGEAANNPTSAVYGGRMVHVPECAAWTWDARPYPFFPALTGVWTDGPNWRLGHWLTGRLGAVSLAALVRHLCLRAGMPAQRIDVTGLWGAVEGYAIGALESPRASITTLARHFGFDAVETGGVIRFVMRGRAAVAEIGADDLVAAPDPRAEGLELTLNNYGGDGAYLALYVTDASGAYVGSLWMAGTKSKYYEHLSDWYRATGGDTAQVNGITGASVGAGRTLDLADALFDAGYTLHIDAAVRHPTRRWRSIPSRSTTCSSRPPSPSTRPRRSSPPGGPSMPDEGRSSFTIPRHAVPSGSRGLSPLQEAMLDAPEPVRICSAPTGAGKSHAFQVAMRERGARILFIVPTRRLAQNLAEGLRQDLIDGGMSADKVRERVCLWTSDERRRLKAEDPGADVTRRRIREIRQEADIPSGGVMIVATPESVAWYLLNPQFTKGGADVQGIMDLLRLDHVVFDEFHTIEARGMGLSMALATFLWQGASDARLTFLSATPIDLVTPLVHFGIPRDQILVASETVVTGAPEATAGMRAIHGDVTVSFRQDASMVDALEACREDILEVLAKPRDSRAGQVVLIFDSLRDLLGSRKAIAEWFDCIGVGPEDRLAISSTDDSTEHAFDGLFTSGHAADPLGFRVLMATSSVEMGVTFRAGMEGAREADGASAIW